MLTSYIIIFLASCISIFLRAFQQRNVAWAYYWWITATAYFIAIVEIYVISNIAQRGWSWPLVLIIGTGGAIGAVSATWMHKTYIKKKD